MLGKRPFEPSGDDVPMESCFGTLKTGLVHQACSPTRDAARHGFFASIEGYYIVSGFTPLPSIAPPNMQSEKPPNPVPAHCLNSGSTGILPLLLARLPNLRQAEHRQMNIDVNPCAC